MSRELLSALLIASAVAAADDSATKALLQGQMPDEAAKPLVQARCMLCHTGDYLTQQRLNQGQWEKTVEKMRKFGAPATDEEARLISAYLAKYWTQELPQPRPVRAAPPSPGSR
jgi:hypothetical protein